MEIKLKVFGVESIHLHRADSGVYVYEVIEDGGGRKVLTPAQFTELLHEEGMHKPWWAVFLNVSSAGGLAWVGLGLLGQVLFTGRMVVQWLVSERSRRSVVPVSFWWMSLIGASMLMVYFVWRRDVVGVLGQGAGWFIYVRNLRLIYKHRRREARTG